MNPANDADVRFCTKRTEQEVDEIGTLMRGMAPAQIALAQRVVKTFNELITTRYCLSMAEADPGLPEDIKVIADRTCRKVEALLLVLDPAITFLPLAEQVRMTEAARQKPVN